MYARMVIGEAVSDEQTREFARIYRTAVLPEMRLEPGFVSGSFMVEEDGRMAVSLTRWRSREECLRYHSSRAYRRFVDLTQHLLVGHFVVKLFKDAEESESS
jgi:quinol monooxygenase YgiN